MATTRRGEAIWMGDLLSGRGSVSAATTGVFRDLDVTWAARTEDHGGRTSPEELLAAAHAGCFSMSLSSTLAKAGTPPERLDVSADVTFDKVGDGWKVVSSALRVRGRVPGADEDGFRAAVEKAKVGCPISGALAGNVEITAEAELAG